MTSSFLCSSLHDVSPRCVDRFTTWLWGYRTRKSSCPIPCRSPPNPRSKLRGRLRNALATRDSGIGGEFGAAGGAGGRGGVVRRALFAGGGGAGEGRRRSWAGGGARRRARRG